MSNPGGVSLGDTKTPIGGHVLAHASTQAWLKNAHLETEVVEEDELDWPGIQIPSN